MRLSRLVSASIGLAVSAATVGVFQVAATLSPAIAQPILAELMDQRGETSSASGHQTSEAQVNNAFSGNTFVFPANTATTGTLLLVGMPRVGEELNVDISGVTDVDGAVTVIDYNVYSHPGDASDDVNPYSGDQAAEPSSLPYTIPSSMQGRRVTICVGFEDPDEDYTAICTALSPPILPVNQDATGEPEITIEPAGAAAEVGRTLTATVGTIDDQNGVPAEDRFRYQWVRVDSDGTSNEVDISQATSKTYLLMAADEGNRVRVKVSFTDDDESEETRQSLAFPPSGTVLPASNNATGEPAISGTAEVGQMLMASRGDVADVNGLPADSTFTYEWLREDSDGRNREDNIASGDSYDLVLADGGKKIRVRLMFTDLGGVSESRLSDPYPDTGTVSAPASGEPTITGEAAVGQTLSADTMGIDDPNGLTSPTYTYQWQHVDADGSNPADIGSNANTYDVVETDARKRIRVTVRFNDDEGNSETATSDDTDIVNAPALGAPTIMGEAAVGQTLSVDTTGIDDPNGLTSATYTYQWQHVDADGSNPASIGSDANSYDVVETDVRKRIRVTVSFSDDDGNSEMATSDDTNIVNAPASGAPTIMGEAAVGQTLSVDTMGIDDPNGLTSPTYTYQWQHVDADGSNPADIGSANTYDVVETDARKRIRVTVRFSDDEGNSETATSDDTDIVNAPASGAPAITGTNQEGQTLTVDTAGIVDLNGKPSTFMYQWQRVDADGMSNPVNIGTDSTTYDLVMADVGKRIRVEAGFTDSDGNSESRTSDVTGIISGADNTPATGTPSISGTAKVGETLTVAAGTVDDPDGLTTVSYTYLWQREDSAEASGWADISGATSTTYTLVTEDRFTRVRAILVFTDDMGNPEERASNAYPASPATVEPVDNVGASGAPTISGTAKVGEEMVANPAGIADANGTIGVTFTYRWQRGEDGATPGWSDINGATTATYTAIKDDEGKKLRVVVSFTDEDRYPESRESAAYPSTGTVARRDNAPATGDLTIDGTPQVDVVLTADTTAIADDNDLGTFAYRWLRAESAAQADVDTATSISGATAAAYTPVKADEAKHLLVRVSFTDGDGYPETVTSDPTASVARRADADPTGAPTISGSTKVDEILTADALTISDANGVSGVAFAYQWQSETSNGIWTDIASANSATYTLAAADISMRIRVQVSFTDEDGYPETVVSDATTPVTSADNNLATGTPTISGMAEVGQTLTAAPGTVDDTDGLNSVSYNYQWQRGQPGAAIAWADISGATSETYALTEADLSMKIRVRFSFADDEGNPEERTSSAYPAGSGTVTEALPNAPTISVALPGPQDGTARVGDTLEVDISNIRDDRGVVAGTFSYQWIRQDAPGNQNLNLWQTVLEATTPTYTLQPDDFDLKVAVQAIYDTGDNRRVISLSEPFPADTKIAKQDGNRPATGVSLVGLARVGETLTANTSSLMDQDGLGSPTLSYQWYHTDPAVSSNAISGATSSTYTVQQGDSGRRLAVVVNFSDAQGNDEEVASQLTAAVGASLEATLSVEFVGGTSRGESHAGTIVAEVTLARSSYSSAISVNYAIGGTATSGADYTFSSTDFPTTVSGTLQIPANTADPSQSHTSRMEFTLIEDTIYEGNETITLTLSNMVCTTSGCDGSNIGIATASATMTIDENDREPRVRFESAQIRVDEPRAGQEMEIPIRVLKEGATALPAVVWWRVVHEETDMAEGVDYRLPSGGRFVEFAADEVQKDIIVTLIGDEYVEPGEKLNLWLIDDFEIMATNAEVLYFPSPGAQGEVELLVDNLQTLSATINSPTVGEGDLGDRTHLDFTVSFAALIHHPVRIGYRVVATSTATAGIDYIAPSGELTVPAHSAGGTIRVIVNGDDIWEHDETVVIALRSATCPECSTFVQQLITLGSSRTRRGIGTIITDDNTTVSIDSVRIDEGDAGNRPTMEFTVSLGQTWTQPVEVQYRITDGTAVSSGADADYTVSQTSGRLTIAAGVGEAKIPLTIYGDDIYELDETVKVTLESATNALLTTRVGTGTIRNDEPLPLVSVSGPDQPVDEGDEGATPMEFTFTRAGLSDVDVLLTISAESAGSGDNLATNGVDFSRISPNHEVTISAREESVVLTVDILGDRILELDEIVTIMIQEADHAQVHSSTAMGTIRNDDLLNISIDSPVLNERDEGSANHRFAVALDAVPPVDISVVYTVTDGTATSSGPSADYSASSVSGTIIFAANTQVLTFSLPFTVYGDTEAEGNETLIATLSNIRCICPVEFDAPMIVTARGEATIRNDDGVGVSILSASTEEGDSGTTSLDFEVVLAGAWNSPLALDYSVSGISATEGADYQAPASSSATLIIPAGDIMGVISVAVIGDEIYESDETLEVTISFSARFVGVSLVDDTVTGTIMNDDDMPEISIDSPSVFEGDLGSTSMAFTVTRNGLTELEISFFIALSGTAENESDFTAPGSSNLTMFPSERTKSIDIPVNGDRLAEADETVIVTLSSVTGAELATDMDDGTSDLDDGTPAMDDGTPDSSEGTPGVGVGTILNDDNLLLSIDSPSVVEGGVGVTSSLTYTVTMAAMSSSTVSVGYSVSGGTATAGADFMQISASSSLDFLPGMTAGTITLQIVGDPEPEPSETVEITLANPACSNCSREISPTVQSGRATGIGTIVDDDGETVSISSPEIIEGREGQTSTLSFEVSLSAPATNDLTVDYMISGGTATSGSDYREFSGGTLLFPLGSSRPQTISVAVTGDDVPEEDETVIMSLSNAVNVTLADGVGIGVIKSDDRSLSITSNSRVREDELGTVLEFTVSLSHPPLTDLSVSYIVSESSTALEGVDFRSPFPPSPLVFARGEVEKTITVEVLDDYVEEQDEIVTLELDSSIAGAVVTGLSATGVIEPRESSTILSVDSGTVVEGGSGVEPTVDFAIDLQPPLQNTATVHYAVILAQDAKRGPGARNSGTHMVSARQRMVIVRNYVDINGGQATYPVSQPLGTAFGMQDTDLLEIVVEKVSLPGSPVSLSSVNVLGKQMMDESGILTDGVGAVVAIARSAGIDRREKGLRYSFAGASRSIATSLVEAVWSRAEFYRRSQSRSMQATIGGQEVQTDVFTPEGGSREAAEEVARLFGVVAIDPSNAHIVGGQPAVTSGGLDDYREWAGFPDSAALANDTRFALFSEDAGSTVFWGRGDSRTFEGDIDGNADSGLTSEGSMMSAMLGLDRYIYGNLAGGVALSSSTGETEWMFSTFDESGVVKTRLYGATPYLHLMLESGIELWTAAGFGHGTAEVEQSGKSAETDIRMQMTAGGIRGFKRASGAADLALKFDAFSSTLSSDGSSKELVFEETEADSSRVRLALEVSATRTMESGSQASGTMDIGARSDSGDGVDGAGMDLAVDVHYRGLSGLELTGRGSLFLAHAHEGFRETALSAGLTYDPDAEGRGIYLSLEPTLNAQGLGSADLWNAGRVEDETVAVSGASLNMRIGYGLGLLHDGATATAYSEYEGSADDSLVRIGAELQDADARTGKFRLKLYVERTEEGFRRPSDAILLEGRLGL